MYDFPTECLGCPLATGEFVMNSTYLSEFKCQCDCADNCSFLDNAKEFINSFND